MFVLFLLYPLFNGVKGAGFVQASVSVVRKYGVFSKKPEKSKGIKNGLVDVAQWTAPCVRKFLEGRPRGNALVGIAFLRVINIPATGADEFGRFVGHGLGALSASAAGKSLASKSSF